MKLLHLHMHLEYYDRPFQNLTEDFKHCVYKNMESGKKATIPKVDELLPELVEVVCRTLEVPLPIEVEKILNPKK